MNLPLSFHHYSFFCFFRGKSKKATTRKTKTWTEQSRWTSFTWTTSQQVNPCPNGKDPRPHPALKLPEEDLISPKDRNWQRPKYAHMWEALLKANDEPVFFEIPKWLIRSWLTTCWLFCKHSWKCDFQNFIVFHHECILDFTGNVD